MIKLYLRFLFYTYWSSSLWLIRYRFGSHITLLHIRKKKPKEKNLVKVFLKLLLNQRWMFLVTFQRRIFNTQVFLHCLLLVPKRTLEVQHFFKERMIDQKSFGARQLNWLWNYMELDYNSSWMLLYKSDSLLTVPRGCPTLPYTHTYVYVCAHIFASQAWRQCLATVSRIYFQATVIYSETLDAIAFNACTRTDNENDVMVMNDTLLATIARRLRW